MSMSIFSYNLLSENNLRSVKPVTNTNVKKKKNWFFSSRRQTVKPVTFNKQDYAAEFYEKYGIIYAGSDTSSCIHSILN